MVLGPAVLVPPGSFVETQHLGSIPDLLNQNLYFHRIPRWFTCTVSEAWIQYISVHNLLCECIYILIIYQLSSGNFSSIPVFVLGPLRIKFQDVFFPPGRNGYVG